MAEQILKNSTNSVLVTRPGKVGEELCELLQQNNIHSEYVPGLLIVENPSQFSQQIIEENKQKLISADVIIVISANAVDYCHNLLPEITQQTPILAMGKASKRVLVEDRKYIEKQIILPVQYISESLLELELLQNIQQQNIVFVCGIGGRGLLEQELQQRGAKCSRIECYQRCYPGDPSYIKKLQQLLAQNTLDCVVVTSGEALENLVKMSGSYLDALLKLQLVVISERIARIAINLGFQKPSVIIENADNAVIVAKLKKG